MTASIRQLHSSRVDSEATPLRPRILFVGEAVSLAHVGRPTVLARWAREAGYKIHFACGSAFASIPSAEGFTPHHLQTINGQSFYARVNSGTFFYTTQELESYVKDELDLIGTLQPDLVVSDFRLSLAISATLTGVPLLSLINAHWSPAAPCAFPAPTSGLFRWLPDVCRERLFSTIRPLAFRTFARPLNAARRRFGLPPLDDFRRHYTAGDHCAYLDMPELSPIGVLPNGHFHLGPVAWEPRNKSSPSLGTLGTSRPLAYVSLGSSGDSRVLPNVLAALLDSACDIALTGVNSEQTAAFARALPQLRSRCIAAPLFNPAEILKHAAVTVCHGGSGTTYQSLAAGVPVLNLPDNPDQGLVAATVAASGAGLTVFARHATRKRLLVAIGDLLHDTHRKKCAMHLARAIAQQNPRACWLNFLARTLPNPSAHRGISACSGNRSRESTEFAGSVS